MLIKFFNHTILRFALKALFRVQVQGLEHTRNLPQRLVIIANHTSFLDVLLLAAFLPVEMKFAVDENIAKQWWMAPLRAAVPLYKLSPLNPFALRGLMRSRAGANHHDFPRRQAYQNGHADEGV
jgi:acyl-[acyl-carrier-protein]-phospholipid O-acyltransferase / long-chain-fatty-acid--[acyl-carrier-protein] ligase